MTPIFLMCAQYDQPARHKEERKRMDEIGIWNNLIVVKDARHGCWYLHPWFKPMVEHMLKFSEERLRK